LPTISRFGSDDEVNQREKWELKGSILVIRESALQCIVLFIEFDGSVVVQLEEDLIVHSRNC
jgi:hypothetical protein